MLPARIPFSAPPRRRDGDHHPSTHRWSATNGADLRAAVFNEHEVRAAAGLTMVIGAVAFSYAYFDQHYMPLRVVTARLLRRVPHPPDARAPVQPDRRRRPRADARAAAGVGLRQAQAVRVDAGPGDVVVDGGADQQRHPRHGAADDLPHLPVADVDGVGARAVPGLQDLRAARATRLDREDPAVEVCAHGECERAVGPPRRDVDRHAPRATSVGPGGAGERRGGVPRCPSGLRQHGDPRRASRHRVPAPRRPRRRLPRLHRRQPVRGVAARGAPAGRARRRLRQPALGQPDVVGVDRARGAGARRRAALLQRSPGRVRLHLHPERHRRAAPRRRGVSVRAAGPVPGDVRQPQLGQRHPRVRPGEGGAHGVRAARGARPARRRRRCSSATSTRVARPAQPLRLPGAVQLLRRQASARVDRAGPRARLGRAAGLRRVRADEPARPGGVEAGLRRDLLLQDVRLPDGPRRTARAARRRSAACGDRGSAAARSSPRPSRATWSCRSPAMRFEDGTVDYLGIPAVEIGLRHLERIGVDTISRRVEALGTWLLEALQRLRHSRRQPRRSASTGPRRGTAAEPPSRSTSCTRTAGSSTSASSTSSRRPTTSRSGPDASAIPAPARPRSRCRGTR